MNCTSPKEVWPDNKKVIVPCGKCIPCLSNKRNDWVFRLKQEHKNSKGALFITLTYHPKYCPDQLVKRHLQLFMKRLRKRLNSRVRYYAVGEYGTDKGRPHYHIILFNYEGTEHELRESWKFGIVDIRPITEKRLAYATKYVIQPDNVIVGKQKPFALMSRGYGLGLSYLTDSMVAWHRSDDRNYTLIEGLYGRLPRYYKDKIWYRDADKKRVSMKSKLKSKKRQTKEMNYFIEKYGRKAKTKMVEFRNAAIKRIKVKVAFTQQL